MISFQKRLAEFEEKGRVVLYVGDAPEMFVSMRGRTLRPRVSQSGPTRGSWGNQGITHFSLGSTGGVLYDPR